MVRSIVHLDADAFFASVEQATDTRLRGKAVAVGGEKRGIIASASYEARRFGIYTPMPTVLARRLCPKLILLPGDFEKYEFFSRLMFSYAYDFTPDVEVSSIDEGYFDLTGVRRPAVSVAETISRAIRQALKLSVSEGVASNKLVSQIASKLKKPSAFQFVPPGREASFLQPLGNQWLPGIGPKTAGQLNAAGLAYIGQIAQTPPELLALFVGRTALRLRQFARGIDERPVVPARASAKSYSQQETFAADTTDEDFLDATLRRMADQLMARVREDGSSIRTLAVKVRYNDMDEEQASESLPEPTDLETEVYGLVSTLLRKAWRRRVSLRLISLKLSQVYDGYLGSALGLDTAARRQGAQQRLAEVVDGLRQKYGRTVLLRGHDFILRVKRGRGEEPVTVRTAPNTQLAPTTVGDYEVDGKSVGGDAPLGRPDVVERRKRPRFFGAGSDAAQSASTAVSGHGVRRSKSCVPLNVHSYYSFLDSTLSIDAIVELARQQELPAVALTDKGNLHGVVELAQAAAQAGIKPIIGAELDWHGQRLCLYVENQKGYCNLCDLLSSKTESGVAEFDALMPTEGLLAVSAARELAPFFPDRFYLAIDSLDAWEKSSATLPRVVSLSIHYAQPADRWKYDVVQSIRTLTLLRQPHPAKRLEGQYHWRTARELQPLVARHPELSAHTFELAERCNFAFSLGQPQFPAYPTPDGFTPAAFLRRLVMDGLQRRYPKKQAQIRPQLEEELAIITEVGYEEYFLVMWDILQDCRRHGIEWITRGSAADSLVCYCLEISSVCPIRFDLYFRRFLNKDRMALNKLPDIDVDFPHDRKDDVIDLIFEKYGPARAAIVGGFSTFQSRSAFAEVAKVLGVSEFQVRRITERLPSFSRAGDLAEVVVITLECRDLPLEEEPYRTALQMACFLDGFPRYPKMHPCGLVLSRQPMHEITPCFTSAKGYPTSHFDMDSIEAVGLIKMDILAQGGLAVMRDVTNAVQSPTSKVQGLEHTVHSLEQRVRGPESTVHSPEHSVRSPLTYSLTHSLAHPPTADTPQSCVAPEPNRQRPPINFAALEPWTDPQIWDLIASGSARAVHHIESPAMISLCKMCNVRDIDTLIAIVSVIRPGAANESKKMEFARRYQDLSTVRYPHPSLERCLHSTYGLVVYEEHILQICEAFAGLPPGRADVLRRALGKEKLEIIEQIKGEFAECARRRGRAEADITAVWELVAGFRGYAFCKAHSTAYGVEAYQSAWLKLHYPAEFMAAVLTNGKGFYDPLVYVLECHRLGIPLRPPSVNEPGPQFRVTTDEPTGVLNETAIEDASQASPTGSAELHSAVSQSCTLQGAQQTCGTVAFQRSADCKSATSPESFRGRQTTSLRYSKRTAPTGSAKLSRRVGRSQSCTLQIRVPILLIKGLTLRTKETILSERQHGRFRSLTDFFLRVQPLNEEMEALIRVGAFDEFGQPRTAQYWESRALGANRTSVANAAPGVRQLWLLAPENLERLPTVPLVEPNHLQRLRAEEELLGYPVSDHPLALFPDIAWDTYCPINRLGKHVGEQIVTCGLVIEQRLFHQVTGEPMKFITIADWTGIVETELFAKTYKSYGLNTIRYRVLEISATVESFDNGRGFTLRVLRAGKPRTKPLHRSGVSAERR
jgi:DNA polymerase III alpha subunit/nucleotidyltransferase/DNA polymerase involved in DNA repair